MSSDRTLPQTGDELRHAQERSLQRTRPPTQVPGYEAERFLGAGAYGEVWVAVDRNTGRRVAIKFYAHRGGLDWSLLSREVEKLAFLFADRYVVQLIDVGWSADPPYYIMEYLEHGSLADRLKNGPLPVGEAAALFREVAVALVHAHDKGVLHCDLKPANVLLDRDGKPRLADFGQSRLSYEQSPALGTLFHMAPEQADLKAVPEARWDVYALGALLYAMLTGEPPHRSAEAVAAVHEGAGLEEQLNRYRKLIQNSPRPAAHRRVGGMDRELAEILERCLAADPRKRYANPQAVLSALDARSQRRSRRPLLVLGAVGPALLMLVMSLFGWNVFNTAVQQSTSALVRRALESNRFAARFVAETVAREIDRRWHILEHEAVDPGFRALLAQATGRPLGSESRDRLQARLEELDREHLEIETASWVVMDATGRQLARSPFDKKTIDRDYSFRDYFHGQGLDFEQGTPGLPPIRDAHLSTVFVSQASNERKVAFSIPVWSNTPGNPDRRILGVLSITVALGQFAELRSESGSGHEQVAVLVDGKKDWSGREGAILEHPHLAALAAQSTRKVPDVYLAGQQIRLLDELRTLGHDERSAGGGPVEPGDLASLDDYQDPIGGAYEGRWLAAIEPVVVQRGPPTQVHDTGWAVIVQERYAAAVTPVEQLGEQLVRRGLMAVGVVLVVVTALWGFVLIVLNESPRFRLVSRLRRRAGLAPPATASGPAGFSLPTDSPAASAVAESAKRG